MKTDVGTVGASIQFASDLREENDKNDFNFQQAKFFFVAADNVELIWQLRGGILKLKECADV